jgi:hypothetical protein
MSTFHNMKRITDDDDDDFDENGILKDGGRMRVPMYARDALQRAVAADSARFWPRDRAPLVTDAAGGTAGLHRPGFRISGSDAQRVTQDHMKNEALAEYDRTQADAWKHHADKPRPKQNAGADAFSMDARQAAYQKYDEEAQQAWRHAR